MGPPPLPLLLWMLRAAQKVKWQMLRSIGLETEGNQLDCMVHQFPATHLLFGHLLKPSLEDQKRRGYVRRSTPSFPHHVRHVTQNDIIACGSFQISLELVRHLLLCLVHRRAPCTACHQPIWVHHRSGLTHAFLIRCYPQEWARANSTANRITLGIERFCPKPFYPCEPLYSRGTGVERYTGTQEHRYTDLGLDWEADLMAHRRPGWCTMASPTTLHIGRPCHIRCTRRALNGWCAGHGGLFLGLLLPSSPALLQVSASPAAGAHRPIGCLPTPLAPHSALLNISLTILHIGVPYEMHFQGP